MSDVSAITRVIEPVVRSLDLDLEDLRISTVGRRKLMKVVVDGDEGVNLDLIADVSRAIGEAIDEANAKAKERIAELQGVTILNINELANAVKSVVLPGETMSIAIIQEGKEMNQGVGYMDDGTMVVVEGGNRHIGQTRHVTVTKVLQTAAGRMIFAKPED